MTDQIFQNRRFANYMKKYVFERRNSIGINLALFIVFQIAFCIIAPYLLGCYEGRGDYYAAKIDPMWGVESKFFIIFMIGASIGCGASFYEMLRKKNDRVALFTCPASSFEKFTTYFLIYFVLMMGVSVLGMFLADAIKVWIYSDSTDTIQPAYIPASYLFSAGKAYYMDLPGLSPHEYEIIKTGAIANIAMIYSMVILSFAFFTLGGTVWIKKGGAKTFVAAWLICFACSAVFYLGCKLFYGTGVVVPNNFLNISLRTAFILVIVFSTLFAIFTWWLSYARFKEWEVIKRW